MDLSHWSVHIAFFKWKVGGLEFIYLFILRTEFIHAFKYSLDSPVDGIVCGHQHRYSYPVNLLVCSVCWRIMPLDVVLNRYKYCSLYFNGSFKFRMETVRFLGFLKLSFCLFPVGLESVAGEAVWECLLFASLAVFKL